MMLDEGLVMVHLDPRTPGVVVPAQFHQDPVLRLNIAYGFNLPALDIDHEGVYAMLSFNRQNFGCMLPWDAIFAMTAPQDGHEGMVWPESIPPEMAPFFDDLGITGGAVPVSLQATGETGDAAPAPEPEPAPRPRPLLVVHEGGQQERDDAGPPRRQSGGTRPRLTVVKD